jgi:hypothetical protein
LHRYLGIGVGALMLSWCLSGGVMHYVRYPQLPEAERIRQLPALKVEACCRADELADDALVDRVQIEMRGSEAVLRVWTARTGRTASLFRLTDGQRLPPMSASEAGEVARSFASQVYLPPQLVRVLDLDQWTVSGEFNAERPLYLFALDDVARTQIYVSSRTGGVVQRTTRRERFWNWLGAIPHWLYFTQLRQHVLLWSQIVIWLSLSGSFLTLTGLYLGVRQLRYGKTGKWSAYRGIPAWHHVAGVLAGVLLLSWIVSGLMSMNPWGLMESAGEQVNEMTLRGTALSATRIKAAVATALPAMILRVPHLVSVQSAPLNGRLYFEAIDAQGRHARFDDAGVAAPMVADDWRQIATVLGGEGSPAADWLPSGDEYYFARPGRALEPAYRVVGNDEARTRFYLDPITGAVIARYDSNARRYRWWHQGLHTLDFSVALRGRPQWDMLVLTLLAGASVVAATGTWIGVRRLLRGPRSR